jgi:hypothetical protein
MVKAAGSGVVGRDGKPSVKFHRVFAVHWRREKGSQTVLFVPDFRRFVAAVRIRFFDQIECSTLGFSTNLHERFFAIFERIQ